MIRLFPCGWCHSHHSKELWLIDIITIILKNRVYVTSYFHSSSPYISLLIITIISICNNTLQLPSQMVLITQVKGSCQMFPHHLQALKGRQMPPHPRVAIMEMVTIVIIIIIITIIVIIMRVTIQVRLLLWWKACTTEKRKNIGMLIEFSNSR